MARLKMMKICTECAVNKSVANDYYNSRSIFHKDGKFTVCKECVEKLVDGDHNKFIEFLSSVNTPLVKSVYEKHGLDIPNYHRIISMKQYNGMTFKDSDSNVVANVKILESSSLEKKYSAKWLGEYTHSEVEYLDTYLEGLHKDFRITNTNHKDYAKNIAKASLHLAKCYEEMRNTNNDAKYKVAKEAFDTLSKTAKFAENSRGSAESSGSFSRISELVENKKYIYKYEPFDKDVYDMLLDNMAHLEKSL